MSTTTSPATFDDIDACDHYYSAATVRLVVGLIEVLCASCGAVTGTLPATMTLAEADEYAGLSQDIGFAWESYGETVAQYRGECAHYGDAWPGAAIEVANGTMKERSSDELR